MASSGAQCQTTLPTESQRLSGFSNYFPLLSFSRSAEMKETPKFKAEFSQTAFFFFPPYIWMHKSAQGTPDGFRVCGKHDLVLRENSEQLKAREPGFGDRTPRRGTGCASEDQDRIRLLSTLWGCPGRPQTTTSTLDGVLHCTLHLGSGRFVRLLLVGMGPAKELQLGRSCLHPHGWGDWPDTDPALGDSFVFQTSLPKTKEEQCNL